MTASAKGTVAEPGRNVAQKAGLNRAILDVSWGKIERQFTYKLAWRGGSRDRFRCTRCGHEADADVNAAIEIRRRGLIALRLRPRREQPGLPVEPSTPSTAPCKTREKEKSGTQPREANAPETVRG